MRAPNFGSVVLTAGLAVFVVKISKRTLAFSVMDGVDIFELLIAVLDGVEVERAVVWSSPALMLREFV